MEEDTTGVFHLYILPPTNVTETTTNATSYSITITSASVFPIISQYTYNSFVTFQRAPKEY